jgi:hypothetical protein
MFAGPLLPQQYSYGIVFRTNHTKSYKQTHRGHYCRSAKFADVGHFFFLCVTYGTQNDQDLRQ